MTNSARVRGLACWLPVACSARCVRMARRRLLPAALCLAGQRVHALLPVARAGQPGT